MVNVTDTVNKTVDKVTDTVNKTVDKVTNRPERTEGGVAKAIETQTSKVPSDWFLWAAAGALGASLAMQAVGSKHRSLFFGQLVPSILLLGVYNKIVKVAGSDQFDPGTMRRTQTPGTVGTAGSF